MIYSKKIESEKQRLSNIILIGMPSCGKSTVGVLLAKNLGFSFIDCDLLIQEKTGELLHKTIEKAGADGFIEIENEVLSSIEATKTVISTGGSAIYGKEAMEHLKSIGKVIYLKISYKTLSKRLGDYVHRGVVLKEGNTLKDMYDERAPLYEKYADAIVDEELCSNDSLGKKLEKTIDIAHKLLHN